MANSEITSISFWEIAVIFFLIILWIAAEIQDSRKHKASKKQGEKK